MAAEEATKVTDADTASADGAEAADAPPRSRRWRTVSLMAVVLIVGLSLAPIGVARFLESSDFTVSGADGDRFPVRLGHVSLGWFSPVRLSDVQIDDAAGQPMIRAKSIVSIRSLASLARDRRNPGRFVITEPIIDVIVRPDGSNLEDFLTALQGDASGSSQMGNVGGSLSEGTLSVCDVDGRQLAAVSGINGTGQQLLAADRSLQLELKAFVEREGERHPIEAAIEWQGPRDGLPFLSGTGTLAAKFAPLPLQPLQSQLSQHVPGVVIHSGSLSGELLVEADFQTGRTLLANGRFISRNVDVTRASPDGNIAQAQWPEEELAFSIDGQYAADADILDLSEFTFRSSPLTVAATGTIVDLHGECVVDVVGDLRYDMSQFLQALITEVQQNVRVDGLRTRQFGIHGPLARVVDDQPQWEISRLGIEADLQWDTADIFGISSDEATIVARLHEGVLRIDPRDVPVSGGRFVAAPEFGLLDEMPAAALRRGPALENVEFSEEMCRLWLKYLSPVLADATRVTGRFSINLDEGRIPLDRMAEGHVAGILQVHTAEVRPGPFAERMVGVISKIRRLIDRQADAISTERMLMTMENEEIPFVMSEGRVHHKQMRFAVAGANIKTSGSVGIIDESLDLLIEVALPESWFKNDIVAAAIGDEVIRIPVHGTFDRPQFDLAVLGELTRRLATKAAGGFLRKLLD